jgi:thioredoxin 1
MKNKYSTIILIALPISLLIFLFLFKGKFEKYVSKVLVSTATTAEIQRMDVRVDSLYNYAENHESYQITLLEFGAIGCVACRKMEYVLEEVRREYPENVNVEFLNILNPENQAMMKHFGVVAIPTQVLLDKNGKEFFRHTGFYSFNDLNQKFNEKLISN